MAQPCNRGNARDMSQARLKIWSFPGGLHLDQHKSVSTARAVEAAPIPQQLILPLSQHIGEAAQPCVSVGDRVLKGQCIARAEGYVSVNLHAPTSGTINAIEPRVVPHPSGLLADCIVLDTDGRDEAIVYKRHDDYRTLDANELRNRIREAGIVGLGGAGFPSFIKLNPGSRASIDTLILNGAECEPYITCDDMLMRERAADIIAGMHIMRHALQAKKCLIGVEDNKIEAFTALREALQQSGKDNTDIQLVRIPTIYPAGGEKQIIYTLTGKQVPSQGLPLDIGIVCHNVGTAAAIYHAVVQGKPLLSRYVTITGSGIPQPRNLDVLFGTPMIDLLEYCHSNSKHIDQLIMGGPMMGFTIEDTAAPVEKTTNCLLALHKRDVKPIQPELPCIRCGDCATVCPAKLLPQQLYWHARAREFDRTQDYQLFECIECGCCSYVCPSHIPLVQYYRFAKTEIWQQERDTHKSDIARKRYEFRLERLEREKREKAERHKQKRSALHKQEGGPPDPKKAAILAALERVQMKKQATQIEPKNIDHLTADQQHKIDEANARRKNSQENN